MRNDRPLGQRLELAIGRLQKAGLNSLLMAATGCRTGETRVGGLRVPYVIRGRGEPVVMIHGFGADKETWMLLVAAMPRRYQIMVLDLPGFGAASAIPPELGTARRQADLVRRVMDRMGVARAHLIGNSMGGGISLRLAADAPDRVTSMALLCSTGPKVEPSELDQALERGENPLLPETAAEAERMLALVMERHPPLPRAISRYEIMRRLGSATRLRGIWEAWHQAEGADGVPDEELSSIDVPALVIHGERDRVLHHSTGREIAARLPRAELSLLPEVGHMPQIEVPRRTARQISEFIDAHCADPHR